MARLFIIEDHALMRRTMITLLQGEDDFEICGEAASGKEALEKLEAANADLVLVDVSLPDMDGFEFVVTARQRWPAVPYLMLSGHEGASYVDRAAACGAAGYLTKYTVNDIVPGIRAVLLER